MLTLRADCQALDWKNHKLICASATETKPAENYRRGLFFPEGEGSPRWEWIETDPRKFEYDGASMARNISAVTKRDGLMLVATWSKLER